jgi:hypothetical protein
MYPGEMNEVQLAPFAMSQQELLPLIYRRQLKAVIFLYLTYSVAVTGIFVWITKLDSAWIVAPVIFALSFVAHRFVTLPAQLRKLDKIFFSTRIVRMTSEGLSMSYEGGLLTFVPWSQLRKCQVLAGVYMLGIPGGNFLQLPRRALSNDEEHFLVDHLRAHGLLH